MVKRAGNAWLIMAISPGVLKAVPATVSVGPPSGDEPTPGEVGRLWNGKFGQSEERRDVSNRNVRQGLDCIVETARFLCR